MQSGLAVDSGLHPGGADLPVGQAEFGKQSGYLGPAGDERLRADIHRHSRKLLGAQHATEPVGRIENGDIGAVAERDTNPVGRDQT